MQIIMNAHLGEITTFGTIKQGNFERRCDFKKFILFSGSFPLQVLRVFESVIMSFHCI